LDHKLLTASDSLARILDLAEDAIISTDEHLRIILFNRGAERMFQYSAEEVKGQPLDILLPARLAGAHREQVQTFAKAPVSARQMAERSRILGRRKDGAEFPAEASISKVGVNGSITFTAILRDVSERVAAEEKIMSSLREKEVLLKEIHHRVKNNLQIVVSLLGLQSRSATDDPMRRMLLESQNRVHTMALLHECLYQSHNLSKIDFPYYIRQLVSHLYHSYEIEAGQIRFETKLDQLYLDMDAAVACGLIINELVSNSLKYAFPDGRKGVVRIELTADANHIARLIVADNGAGRLNQSDLANAKTLGLRLVRTLAEQLGGTIELGSNNGAEARLTFPVNA
jgi:two-component system, sensor histidine kinase PdtaS